MMCKHHAFIIARGVMECTLTASRSAPSLESDRFAQTSAGSPRALRFSSDVRQVMGHVLDLGRSISSSVMSPRSLCTPVRDQAASGRPRERPGHLSPHPLQQGQLLLEVGLVVGQPGGEPGLVVADQQRPILDDHPLHPVAPGLLAVDQVADDLERAPFPRHRASP